ncbi:molybdopterin molybdotransferase [Arcanobacterium pluranimalium]|uniref:molybdopterin molybdotransferase MoeA n=1 Tax=Arcanobacterium pluranimalium TaxID=108028 RepID=UPI001EF876F3|nr:gephyrin-like molybdotransferase Glp [Arcanobacterium pluranimalium]MBM7824540.1 molybdopterin molybdotransferase [Arcanobacterium pluranimalium]
MLSPEEYLQLVIENLQPHRLSCEVVDFDQALDRTLAQDVTAQLNVPPFNNSAMDGFAVRTADFSGEPPYVLPVVCDIAAGTHDISSDCSGSVAARIMTGAPVPSWADAVVKIEDTDAPRGASKAPVQVTISVKPTAGQNIRCAGEDVRIGDVVMQAGTTPSALAISTLVSIGQTQVQVARRPRVAVISTGSELVDPGVTPEFGQIPDSNASLIAHLAQAAGAQVVGVYRSGDTADTFAKTLDVAAQDADLIVTSGGVSMGAFDPVKEFGLAHGFSFEKVAMQPGKPQGHGTYRRDSGHDVGVLCLPGNPVSVAVSFTLFVAPVIAVLLGKDMAAQPGCISALAGASWKSPAGRRQYLPGKLTFSRGELEITPIHALGSGSHLVASLAQADALAVVEADISHVAQGDRVNLQLMGVKRW